MDWLDRKARRYRSWRDIRSCQWRRGTCTSVLTRSGRRFGCSSRGRNRVRVETLWRRAPRKTEA